MTRNVVLCDPDTSLQAAAQLMKNTDCGCLPVTTDTQHHGDLLGLVTDRDLVCRALADGMDPVATTVALVMSSPVETVSEDASLEDCLQHLSRNKIRRLVVLDREGQCSGIITQGDVARHGDVVTTGVLVKDISQNTPSAKDENGQVLHRG